MGIVTEKKPCRHWKRILRRVMIFFALGFALQCVLAMFVSPFLQFTQPAPFLNGVSAGIVAETDEVWACSPGTVRMPFKWGVPFAGVLGLPPEWRVLSLTIGSRIDAFGGGPVMTQTDRDLPVIRGVPHWSIMAYKSDSHEVVTTGYARAVEQATGWPWPSMYGRVRYRLSDIEDPVLGFVWEKPRYEWSVPIPHLFTLSDGTRVPAFDDALLPLRPILLGGLANAGLYGLGLYVVYWIVLSAFRLVWRQLTKARKHERIGRGECVQCGYLLGDLKTCPECGHPVP